VRTPIAIDSRMRSAVCCGQVLERNSELINGRASYLLYGQLEQPVARLAAAFRVYTQALMRTIHVESVVNMYVRVMMETYILAVMLALIVGAGLGKIDPASAGVVISALFAVNGSVTFLENASSQMARQSAHTHRIFEYADLPDEESGEHAIARPRSAAPSAESGRPAGALSFERLSVSYRADSPVILRDVSLRIPAGAKVGLIGRSGSGKTSLVQAMLRLVYVHGGDLLMDGQSLYGMPIAEARRRFGVVPQSPWLFEGTLRDNLDRPGLLGNASLAAALAAVGLDLALDQPIAAGGANLSVGQRQLVCLARVIAAGKPVIVLDEPTSGLDADTDRRVQEVLRSVLRERTVITVAHRRESLRGHDLIVEMHGGAIARVGSPQEILGEAILGEAVSDACPA
jgi:ABC-type multidrug transport system fused ATPase/permease subunit